MPADRGRARWRHGIVAILVLTLAAGVAPVAVAQESSGRFVDDDNSVHEAAIEAIAAIGLTLGCNPPANDRYCPDRSLSRGEMATMLVRAGDLPSVPGDRFADTTTSVHRDAIESLAAAGVTRGCNPPANNRFCPDSHLTRGELAAFLARVLELDAAGPEFIDSGGHLFASEISALAAAGVTAGCNPPANDRFCPDRLVTRGEIATFLARAFDLTVTATEVGGTAYPGQPGPGTVLWGAAVGQNTDPGDRHERPTGHPLSLHRTFFQWNHRAGYMADMAADDIANDRLPWVSIKTPGWELMASGSLDDEIDEMLIALDGSGGSVWLTVHHEPEGGGGVNAPDDAAGPSGHLAMNRRVRQRMDALGTKNIALAPILMDWTWDPRSGREIDAWWDGDVYDFIGVDHYVCYSGSAACEDESMLNEIWFEVRRWAGRHGVDVAVGEWGMRGTDSFAGQRMTEWYEAAVGSHDDGQGGRVVAMSAFDSAANVPESFMLAGAQLSTFHNLMTDTRTADPVG